MKLTLISVENYKSYLEKQTVLVESGFNIFLGGNNAGKTTMLEPLDANYVTDNPHRSVKNLLTYGQQPSGWTTMSLKLETDIHEMRDPQTRWLQLSIGENWREKISSTGDPVNNIPKILSENPKVELLYEFGGNRRVVTTNSILGTNRQDGSGNIAILTLQAELLDNGTIQRQQISNLVGGLPGDTIPTLNRLTSLFYRFSAHRRPAGRCMETVHPVTLSPDATNLAYCLNVLQSTDSHGHQILCEWVNRIFPAVRWIQASPRLGNFFEIECLPLPPSARRNDLAIPLDKMGSGIGNVIAMLYVVLTARLPRVIAIDEPNSYLHPKALRELLQIFSIEGKIHQYLLTAHSADVLTAIPPSLVTMFDLTDGATSTQQVKGTELMEIREGLSDLGIRMTDLHGRDRVLWVEGQTEELIMPRLLQYFCSEVAPGTAILRVEHTGTFEKKGVDPKEVAALYSRLTNSTALVPPMVAILLDRETRSEEECMRLSKSSGNILKFLDETMLENYVLHPGAIAQTLMTHGETVSSIDIQEFLNNSITSSNEQIDGAKILKSAFTEFSEARTEFKKTRDVPLIVDWLLVNEPNFLRPLGNFLRNIFNLPAQEIH